MANIHRHRAGTVLLAASVAVAAGGPARASGQGHGWGRGRGRGHGAAACDPLRRSLHLEPFGRSAPEGARIVPFCDYLDLVQSGAVKPFGRGVLGKQRAALMKADAENLVFILRYLARHPEAADLRNLMRSSPHGRNGDGTHRITLSDGNEVVTLGPGTVLAGLADSLRLGTDRERQLQIYSEMYDALPAGLFDPATGVGLDLPTPASLADAPVDQIRDALQDMSDLSPLIQSMQPIGPVTAFVGCRGEVGASNLFGDDRYTDPTAATAVHDGFGLYATFNFPDKPYLTCVRDQAVRGTCTTFALTSATEMLIARATGTFVNLSEQDIWEHYNLGLWGGNVVMIGESGTAKTQVAGIIANGYAIPYERSWDYNASQSRNQKTYEHSCDAPYPSALPCSNTTPQAPWVCGLDPQTGNMDCSLEDANVPGSSHTIWMGGNFWYSGDSEWSTNQVRLHVAANEGVTIGITTTPRFRALNSSNYGGYLVFDANDKPVAGADGGHELHVVGFISKEDAVQAIPGLALVAPREGYFIVKNSWGPGWGDKGFGYLPWDFVKTWGWEALYVSGVQ
jgi:papain like protease